MFSSTDVSPLVSFAMPKRNSALFVKWFRQNGILSLCGLFLQPFVKP